MEILNLLLFGLIYIIITFINGHFLLEILKIDYRNTLLNLFVGFLLVETLSFLFFIMFGLLGFKDFIVSYLPNIVLSIASIFYLFIRTKKSPFSKFQWSSILRKPALFLFLSITGLYFANLSELFFNVLTSSGIIYQDIVYHGGIVQSIINFGYPVNDLQFNGKLLNYHILTHFIAAKFSYISFTNVFISYHVFLNFVGTLFYSFLSVLLVERFFLSIDYKSKYLQIFIGVISFTAFFCTFLLGGVMNNSFTSAFYLSASFQWQLFIFLIFFLILFSPNVNIYNIRYKTILIILLFTATLIKVSSLPLIIAGLGAIFLFNLLIFNKEKLVAWGQILIATVIWGGIIFISFFKVGASQSSTLDFNIDLLLESPIIVYFDIESLPLVLAIYLIIALSFRFVLIFKIRKPETWFAGAILLAGFLLSLLVKDNQLYFIMPAIILSSHLAIIYIFQFKLKNIYFLPIMFIIILSFYPIGGFGISLKDRFERKRNYYPLNSERIELYSWIREHSDKNDVFFTTTNYASSDMMADNYAPAAFSGRKSYLGGFRFGGVEYEKEFQKRLELTENFNLIDKKIWRVLRKDNIEYGLIEKNGNFNEKLFANFEKSVNEDLYHIVYKNNQGIIFQLIHDNSQE